MIRLKGLKKAYDRKVAVDGVDLEVEKGSLFGLIGPNGAGKTTTLKMLATLIKPDAGSIEVDGLDAVEDVRALRRRLGYMPDAFGVFPGFSGVDYLEFFGRSYGLSGRPLRERLEGVLELTELTGVRDELTSSLSTGMRQRLSLAKTLLHDPDLLVLDEPASGLDPRARIEIRSLLKELGRMGKTIVISSHILADLEEICTAVGIIEQGRVVWHGSMHDAAHSVGETHVEVRIRVEPKHIERALTLLGAAADISDVRRDQDRIIASTLAGASNDALRTLIDQGIEIIYFQQSKTDLEAIFLQRTKGIVS
jgi:ABC-2 type transport system ATP-binding protein